MSDTVERARQQLHKANQGSQNRPSIANQVLDSVNDLRGEDLKRVELSDAAKLTEGELRPETITPRNINEQVILSVITSQGGKLLEDTDLQGYGTSGAEELERYDIQVFGFSDLSAVELNTSHPHHPDIDLFDPANLNKSLNYDEPNHFDDMPYMDMNTGYNSQREEVRRPLNFEEDNPYGYDDSLDPNGLKNDDGYSR